MSDTEAAVADKKRGRNAVKAKTAPAAKTVEETKKRGRVPSVAKLADSKEAPKKDVESTDGEENAEPVVKKPRGRGRPPAKGKAAAKKKAPVKKGRGRPPAAKKEEMKEKSEDEEKSEDTEEEGDEGTEEEDDE